MPLPFQFLFIELLRCSTKGFPLRGSCQKSLIFD